MNLLDLINSSVVRALGCDMEVFLRYFPAAEIFYNIFVILAIGLVMLNLVWQLFTNFGLIAGVETEESIKLTICSIIFIFLIFYSRGIVNIILNIGGTPCNWILTQDLPPISFSDFNSVLLVLISVFSNGSVALIALILLLILAWNYIKLLFEASGRYVLLGVMVYTVPVAFAMGSDQLTSNIFKIWCKMFAEQIFLLSKNA